MVVFWVIYAWLFTAIGIFSLVGRLVLRFKRPKLVSWFDVVESGLVAAALPGLFGYAYDRPMGPQVLWQVGIVLLLVLSVRSLFSSNMKHLADKGVWHLAGALVVTVITGAPGMYALICYAYFSPGIWR